jgi:hypothetical protein
MAVRLRLVRSILARVALPVLFHLPAFAQITGHISGTILDSSGAGVAAARVKLTGSGTGDERAQASDGEGRFAFHQLRVGEYRIIAEAAGFSQLSATAVVRAGETAVVSMRLEVGLVTETIQVTDAATPLDAANSQIQLSVAPTQIFALPVTRNPALLALIAPGVVPVTPNNPYLGSGSYNAHGGRGRANNITIDNITSSDIVTTGVGGSQLGPLNFEQIQEVKLVTNNFSAEYGRNGSSQLQFVTKSGTNALHGAAFEFVENDKFNARDFFDQSGKPAVTRMNDYGFALGGPIVRDRTHFFVTYEGNPVRGEGTARIAQVPTPAMLAMVTDQASRHLLDVYKIPVTDSGQIQQSGSDSQDARQFSVRLDHRLSANDSLTGRFAYYQAEGTAASLTFISTNLEGFGASFVNGPRNFNLSETHLFSSRVVNEARFGFGRSSPYFTPQNAYVGPRIIISNLDVDAFGQSEQFPQGRTENTFQYGDTITWMKGAHGFKAGLDVYRYQLNSLSDAQTRGVYRFNTWQDFAVGQPASWQERFGSTVRGHRVTNEFFFLQDDWRVTRNFTVNLGIRAEVAGGVGEVNGLTSNLDLNCRDAIGSAGTGPLGCFTIGQPSNRTNVNWSPRLGFAWSPGRNSKTVIRGGYGIAYDFLFLNPIINQRSLPPFIYTGSLTGTSLFTGANSWGAFVAGTAQAQTDGLASMGRINPAAKNFGVVNPAIDTSLRNPQTQQWSLGIERQVSGGIVLKGAYVGTKSNYLQRVRPINLISDSRVAPAASLADEAARLTGYRQAISAASGTLLVPSDRLDPRFNDVNLLDSSANSNYHAAEFSAQRAFVNGYSVQVSYTISKSIDDVSDALGGTLINDSSGQQNPGNNRDNRAVSQFDIPQRVVVAHVWELPFGKRLENRWLRRAASGWSVSGISSYRSGFPYTLEAGTRLAITPLTLNGFTGGPVRPNALGPVNIHLAPAGSAGAQSGLNADPVQRISAYAASLGLSQPLLGNYGSLGRNGLRLNGAPTFDWSFAKNTPVTERVNLQLRAECYNLFNTTVFQDVNRTITSATFGQYTTTAVSSRYIHIAARLIF